MSDGSRNQAGDPVDALRIRPTRPEDAAEVLHLYVTAAEGGTLGRDPDEYEEGGIRDMIEEAIRDGIALVAEADGGIVGEIHASRLPARRFSHVVGRLTAAVDPRLQGRGVGRRLFEELLRRVDALEPPVTRVELMLQAGNPAALRLYSSLGFAEEGRLRDRVRAADGAMLDDLFMARLRRP